MALEIFCPEETHNHLQGNMWRIQIIFKN